MMFALAVFVAQPAWADALLDAFRVCETHHETIMVGSYQTFFLPTYQPGFESCVNTAAQMAARNAAPPVTPPPSVPPQ